MYMRSWRRAKTRFSGNMPEGRYGKVPEDTETNNIHTQIAQVVIKYAGRFGHQLLHT